MISWSTSRSSSLVSYLGLCTGSELWKESPLLVVRSYFDGSEGDADDAHRWLTLAGFVGNDSLWGDFDRQWGAMLRNREPVAQYIHMREMLSKNGEFKTSLGWTDDKIYRLIDDAIHLLQQYGQHTLRGFFCSVDTTAWSRITAQTPTLCKPHRLCTRTCILAALNWYRITHAERLERAFIYFDEREGFMHEFRQKWLKDEKRKVKDCSVWGLVTNVLPLEARTNPGLQAADMLAWARTRSLFEQARPMRYLADILLQVLPLTGRVFDEDALHRLASGEQIR